MILSERGAIKSAICDGGFHIYPAAKITEYIKSHLEGDELKGDFDPVKTPEKLRSVPIEGDNHTKSIFKEDLETLCSRLSKMDKTYDLEGVLNKMSKALLPMAKHYFNIDHFESVKGKVVEYFFEGYNDLYKDADWNAFSVDPEESKHYNVPVGTYFKRNQVSPGDPEFMVAHENIHQFTAHATMDELTGYYVLWICEGFADVFGQLMLYKATKDLSIINKLKNIQKEFGVLDPRKSTYYYEGTIARQFISTADLPLTKAFFKLMSEFRANFDWSGIGRSLLAGMTAYQAIVASYTGKNKSSTEKQLDKWTKEFEPQGRLDDDDRMILRSFGSIYPPAVFDTAMYRAANWIMDQFYNNPEQHYCYSKFFEQVGREEDKLIKIGDADIDKWKSIAKGNGTFIVLKDDIPADLHEATEMLGNYFCIVKLEADGKTYFDILRGGLPYRMETDEIRCGLGV